MGNVEEYLPLWKNWHTLNPVSFNPGNTIFEALGDEEPFCAIITYMEYSSDTTAEELKASFQDYCAIAKDSYLTCFKRCVVYERADGNRDVFFYMPGYSRLNLTSASLNPERLLESALRITSAVDALHKAGITHENLNLSNIFTTADGHFVLGGHVFDAKSNKHIIPQSTYTYSSFTTPEITAGKPADKLDDLYSLGVLLYALYNNGILPDVSVFSPPCNAESHISSIIQRACSVQPNDRYQSADELFDALKAAAPLPPDNDMSVHYPDLTDYLLVFDPENSITYPPPLINNSLGNSIDGTVDTRSKKNRRRPLLQALALLLFTAIIIVTFILLGINRIPGLEPSQPPPINTIISPHLS